MIIKVNYTVSDVYMSTSISPVYIKVVYSGVSAGGGTWGSITGTLSNQTDLQAALDDKVPYTGATGNVDLGANKLTLTSEQFNSITAPAYSEGLIWYDTAQKSLAFYNDSSLSPVFIGENIVLKVYNNTGATISKGAAVYIQSGGAFTYPNVALAKADVASTSAVIGLMNAATPTGTFGYVTSTGVITGVNTGSMAEGTILYLSPYSAGNLMNTIPPTGYVIQVGVVAHSNTPNGTIYTKQTTPLAISAATITGAVSVLQGGTGATTASGALTNLGGVPTTRTLTINGTTLDLSADRSWTVGGSMAIGGAITSATAGSVLFAGTSGVLQQDNANLFWDDTNNRLGIGTATPTKALEVASDILINGLNVGRGNGSLADNTAFGFESLNVTTGLYNAAFGYRSLKANTTGAYNTSIGHTSMPVNTTGQRNTSVGMQGLSSNIGGSQNSAFGMNALRDNTSGGNNTAIGYAALQNNTTGVNNTALGNGALNTNTTGYSNMAIGYFSLNANLVGFNNTAIGYYSLLKTTGNYNTGNGANSLEDNTTGSNNTAIGYIAGRGISGSASGNAITNNSIYIGYDTRALANNQTNQIVIGYQETGLGSNTTIIGNSSTITTALRGRLLLGTLTDSGLYQLDVNGTARVSGNATFGTLGTGTGMFWDNTNNRLGIGTNAPTATLQVNRAGVGTMFKVSESVSNTEFSIYPLSSPTGALIFDIKANNTTNGFGSVYAGVSGHYETVFSFYSGQASTNNKACRIGNFGYANYFAFERLNDAGSPLGRPLTIFSSTGNMLIQALGSSVTDTGFIFTTLGNALFKGAGTTSATNALNVQDSAGTNIFQVRNDKNIIAGTGTNLLFGTTLPTRQTDSNSYPGIFVGNSNSSVMGETTTNFKGIYLMSNFVRQPSPNFWVCQDTTKPAWKLGLLYELDTFFINRAPAAIGATSEVGLFTINGSGLTAIGSQTPTARLDISASTTANASLRIRSGTAPTTPNDGDIWFDGTNLKMQIGGVTKTFTLI